MTPLDFWLVLWNAFVVGSGLVVVSVGVAVSVLMVRGAWHQS